MGAVHNQSLVAREVSKQDLAEIVTSRWIKEPKDYETVGFSNREDVSCPSCDRHKAVSVHETIATGQSPFVLAWGKLAGCSVEYVYCRSCGFRHVRVDGDVALHDKCPPR